MTASLSGSSADEPVGYADARSGSLRGNRLRGIAAALAAELLIIALLLSVSWGVVAPEGTEERVTTISAQSVPAEEEEAPADDAPEEAAAPPIEAPQPTEQPVEPEPREPIVDERPPPVTLPSRQPILRESFELPAPDSAPSPAPSAAAPPARTYGPPDTGPQNASMDSERVGTAPNGEPMYAARWYREPTDAQLAGYLSTATAPSTALIVCRTIPNFQVDDCELIGEQPRGSQIGRAVLAAAWQFRVRPAIVGGQSQVGSWVRIRIDYSTRVQR